MELISRDDVIDAWYVGIIVKMIEKYREVVQYPQEEVEAW